MYGELIKTISSGHNDIKLVINSNIKQTRHQYNHKKMGESSYTQKEITRGKFFKQREFKEKLSREYSTELCAQKIENLDTLGSFLGKYNISK